MGAKTSSQPASMDLRKLRRRLNSLDPSVPGYNTKRSQILADIQLAKSQLQRTSRPSSGKRRPKRKSSPAKRRSAPAKPEATKSKGNLSKLLSPKNLQESLKTVGNLRTMVKNWMQYLQQADQLLDTIFLTSNSLKETGVLDKLIKSKGKNLKTEDFTNILMALMNSPVGAHLFKSDDSEQTGTEEPSPPTK